jgi:hypothetical protein
LRARSIPLGDAWSLEVAGKRARAIRVVLAATLLAATVAAFFAARSHNLTPTPLLPPGSSGIIVLDLSSSVEHSTLDRMYAGLTQLGATNDRFGVVVFSARAYEALPPNTPARELAPFARFFHNIPPGSIAFAPGGPRIIPPTGFYPTNPWSSGFSGGTEISTGLALARRIVTTNALTRPSVWLMSDLADDPPDRRVLQQVAKSYIDLGITLHVVALNPLKADARFFGRLLGPRGSLVEAKPSNRVRLADKYAFPIWLAVSAVALSLLLAANELFSTPLAWRSAGPVEGTGSA